MERNETNKILLKDEKVLHTYKPLFTKNIIIVILTYLVTLIIFIPSIFVPAFNGATELPVTNISIGAQMWIAIAAITLFFAILLLCLALAHRNKFYVVTNKRFIIQKGFIGIDFSSIPVDAVEFISVNVSPIDKMIKKGTGNITFGTVSTPITNGQPGRFVFANLTEVYENYRLFKTLIDEARD